MGGIRKMARYSLAIDVSRCDGCGSCFLACKDEHIGNDHLPLSAAQPRHGHQWMRINEIEQGEGSKVKMDYIPVMCQHCKEPACAKGAPDGAVVRRKDGIVILDPEKSEGCADMVNKCPYGAIFWNGDRDIPQKCGMCAHMLDNGEMTTRCAESCPTQALFFGDLDDPESEISKYIAQRGDFEVLRPEFDTEPTVLYRKLPAPFITGEVILADKPGECCEGASVTCVCECGDKLETETDFMGDFQFTGLNKGKKYTVTVAFSGYKSYTAELFIHTAKNLGTIQLER